MMYELAEKEYGMEYVTTLPACGGWCGQVACADLMRDGRGVYWMHVRDPYGCETNSYWLYVPSTAEAPEPYAVRSWRTQMEWCERKHGEPVQLALF